MFFPHTGLFRLCGFLLRGIVMKYDFTSILERHGKDAIAVDGLGTGFAPSAPKEGFDAIPMWVADMNFPTVSTIQEAIIERTKHPMFGYFNATKEYYDSIIQWQEKRNGVTGLTAEAIGYENGVLGGVISALNCVCSRGDKILIHSPTYIGFTMSLKNNGYEAVHSPLVKDENGVWRMDFEDMEKHLKEEHIHAAIMCNPHNPCGRVWERWELEKAMALFKKYDVYVISDEIWSDLILPGHHHIPTQTVSEDAKMRTVAMYAPSKTFNLAGMMISNVIIRDEDMRKIWLDRHYNFDNPLSIAAAQAAYEKGDEWLQELRAYLDGNFEFTVNYLKEHLPKAKCRISEATYLAWVDLSAYFEPDEHLPLFFAYKAGVLLEGGNMFVQSSDGFIRLNLACPRATVEEGLRRICEAVNTKHTEKYLGEQN